MVLDTINISDPVPAHPEACRPLKNNLHNSVLAEYRAGCNPGISGMAWYVSPKEAHRLLIQERLMEWLGPEIAVEYSG